MVRLDTREKREAGGENYRPRKILVNKAVALERNATVKF
jgi:hypothetical protein